MTARTDILLNNENIKAATAQQIAHAEKILGIELPNDYKELLKIQDGGYLAKGICLTDFPTSWAADHFQVAELFGISTKMSIIDSPYLIKKWALPKNIVLISGNVHNWIALDYRYGTSCPSVLLLDEDGEGIQTIALDFSSFINGLTTEDDIEEIDLYDFDEEEEHDLFEWDEEILFEAEQVTEEMKRKESRKIRNGRSTEELKHEIDDMIKHATAPELANYFQKMLRLYNGTLERYLIQKIFDHPSNELREEVAEHLAACTVRGFETLSKNDVEKFLHEMKAQEHHAPALWFIEHGLARINH